MKSLLENTVNYCQDKGVEYCEVRLSKLLRNVIQVRNDYVSIVEPSASSFASIRVLDGAWGFSFVNEFTDNQLKTAADQAIKLAKNTAKVLSKKVEIVRTPKVHYSNLSSSPVDPREGSIEELQEIFLEATKEGGAIDERITLVLFHCENDLRLDYYANSDGSWIESFTPRTFLISYAMAKDGAKVKRKRNRLVVSAGSEVLAYSDPISLGRSVVEEAISTLDAKQHPTGNFPVIIDNFLGGTFGSLLSGELKGSNILSGTGGGFFKDKLNKQIASEIFSISNNPSMEGMPVYYEYDAEGVKAVPTQLVENGVLKGYLHDRTTAAQMNVQPTGCTRSVDASRPPTAEFGNVIIKNGEHSLPEMIEDIQKGIYARGLAGASTIGTKSMITSESGFLIENGELTDPLDQVSFTIDTATDLTKIDAIGKDFSPASIRSYSGAYYALIGTGSPHIRFQSLEVK